MKRKRHNGRKMSRTNKQKKHNQLERQLTLMRSLIGQGWIESLEIVVQYCAGKFTPQHERSSRRLAERDLRALQKAGVPIEWKKGFWRLTPQEFARWRNI